MHVKKYSYNKIMKFYYNYIDKYYSNYKTVKLNMHLLHILYCFISIKINIF